MKILHTSDWHVGVTLRGRSRADEHREVLAEIVGIAEEQAADIVIVVGDLFHHAAPGPESEKIVYDTLLMLARDGRQVVVVAGNHDNPKRIEAIRPLLDRVGIHAAGLPRPTDAGGTLRIETPSGEVARIALIPFLSQRGIVRVDDLMGGGAADHVQQYADRFRRIVSHLCEGFEDGAINLLVSHVAVAGARVGGGEREAHTVFDYYVTPQAFPADAHYVALGHLHRAQAVPGLENIRYSGAPIQVDFSEDVNDPCVLLVEAEAGRPARVEKKILTSHRRLLRLRGTREALMKRRDSVGDAYLRVEVEERPAPGLADEIRETFPNAVDVRVVHETDVPEVKPAIDVAKSPKELFSQYLDERSIEPEDLLRLFDELIQEEYETSTT